MTEALGERTRTLIVDFGRIFPVHSIYVPVNMLAWGTELSVQPIRWDANWT